MYPVYTHNFGKTGTKKKIDVKFLFFYLIYLLEHADQRELMKRLINKCRCDERLKSESESEGTPKDRDEVNRREVGECDRECVIVTLKVHRLYSK